MFMSNRKKQNAKTNGGKTSGSGVDDGCLHVCNKDGNHKASDVSH